MKQPFLALCMIVRDAADTIDTLLKSVLECPEGPAFDEYVFVDTGSVDSTRDKILEALNRTFCAGLLAECDWSWEVSERGASEILAAEVRWERRGTYHGMPALLESRDVRIVLANFKWIDDFAAARNYSFELARAVWKMYLDADDELPTAPRLRKQLQATAASQPQVNCIAAPYIYSPTVTQVKHRIVRWADGWRWSDEIHEYLVKIHGGQRVLSVYHPLVVYHRKTVEADLKSLERNLLICERVHKRATEAGDTTKVAVMARYLGLYHHAVADITDGDEREGYVKNALAYFGQAAAGLPLSSVSALSLVDMALILIERGDFAGATEKAGMAIGHGSSLPETWLVLGMAHSARGFHELAARVFDAALALPPPEGAHDSDATLVNGRACVAAALSYAEVGRVEDALKTLERVPMEVRADPRVQRAIGPVQSLVMRKYGIEALERYVTFLLWDTQPMAADRLLAEEDLLPAAIAGRPEIAALQRFIRAKTPQLESWPKYKATYDEVSDESFHTQPEQVENVRRLGRARAVVAWAESLPKEGPPVRVLSIGAQDGLMERWVLEANPRVHMTVVDASEKERASELELAFPGRATTYHMKEHHYDWPKGPFEAIFFFEVLEHLPSPTHALAELQERLVLEGDLFLSTPVADRWIEPHLTDPKKGPKVLYHVSAFNPTKLWSLLREQGFNGRLEATDNGMVFLARMKNLCREATRQSVAIYVPGGSPLPFDADSLKRGHVGGSEEAVIHLSSALAKHGFDVTVYAPRPKRRDDVILYGQDGVLWRDSDEFDFAGDRHEAVLFWRCPQVLPLATGAYAKLLWLHDAQYGVPDELYEKADAAIVLSKFHKIVIEENDGYPADADNYRYATNGIDPASFPEPDESQRDPHRVVYGSSPDRGLVNLLQMWPLVRKQVPDAKLDIFYSWKLYEEAFPAEAKELREHVARLKDQGVTYHGGVPHHVLHEAYRKASVWAYPTSFPEISCITAMKVLASGCFPVVTAAGAIPETLKGYGSVLDFDTDEGVKEIDVPSLTDARLEFINTLVERLTSVDPKWRVEARAWALRTYAWTEVAERFAEHIEDAIMVARNRRDIEFEQAVTS